VHWSVRAEGHADLTTQTYFDGDVLVGVADIRAKNGADHILHFREGFDGGLRGASLKAARRVATEELVARFVAHDDGVPRGSVTLRLGG
jgi:protocatechuate 3,4-dioxygenase beta subunit